MIGLIPCPVDLCPDRISGGGVPPFCRDDLAARHKGLAQIQQLLSLLICLGSPRAPANDPKSAATKTYGSADRTMSAPPLQMVVVCAAPNGADTTGHSNQQRIKVNSNKKRIVTVTTAVAVALGAGGAAWAAWSSSGTGSASATAGSAAAITVTGASAGAGLRPGHPVDAVFTINNPNDYPVKISQLTIDTFGSTTAACDAAATFEYNTSSTTPTVPTIAPNTSASVTWSQAIKLTADPDNDCQGAEFHFNVNASGDSAA